MLQSTADQKSDPPKSLEATSFFRRKLVEDHETGGRRWPLMIPAELSVARIRRRVRNRAQWK